MTETKEQIVRKVLIHQLLTKVFDLFPDCIPYGMDEHEVDPVELAEALDQNHGLYHMFKDTDIEDWKFMSGRVHLFQKLFEEMCEQVPWDMEWVEPEKS